MSKTDNLSDFLTDVADAIRAKKGTTDLINPQEFSSEIASIEGGGGKIKLPDGTKFANSTCSNFDWLKNVDTSEMTSMAGMFHNCAKSTSFDLSSFDTSAVTAMNAMFKYCSGIKSLDLSSFDTSAVTNMGEMFAYTKMNSLNLSSLNTAKVTSMGSMFAYCSGVKSLDLSSFDTSAVTGMGDMFHDCSSLETLDVSSFNTENVKTMSNMFYYCPWLKSLDLSSFDTSAVTGMGGMFTYCSRLSSLLLGVNFFKTKSVTSIDFSTCNAWVGDTVVTSLVTNSYDRAAAGLSVMTLKLHANTKAALTDEQKATITAKGYTIA